LKLEAPHNTIGGNWRLFIRQGAQRVRHVNIGANHDPGGRTCGLGTVACPTSTKITLA
jgi:hypothetical protein